MMIFIETLEVLRSFTVDSGIYGVIEISRKFLVTSEIHEALQKNPFRGFSKLNRN